jgi:TadE-like protein
MMSTRTTRRSRGQTLAELGIVMPLLMFLLLGILQIGFLIYQQYEAVNLAREAANLILRDEHLNVAEDAIKAAQLTRNFDTDVKLILSVVQLGASPGPNADVPIVVQRHAAGTLAGDSILGDQPASSYQQPPMGAPPTDDTYAYKALDLKDQSIRATNPLPNGLTLNVNQSVYVAEVYLKRRDILPLSATARPLYAVAYF